MFWSALHRKFPMNVSMRISSSVPARSFRMLAWLLRSVFFSSNSGRGELVILVSMEANTTRSFFREQDTRFRPNLENDSP